MKHAMPLQSSYAALFDPAVARAVVEHAAQWNLPRYICHPLDRYTERRASADLAAFDAAVDLAPVPEAEIPEDAQSATDKAGAAPDADFENDDDL